MLLLYFCPFIYIFLDKAKSSASSSEISDGVVATHIVEGMYGCSIVFCARFSVFCLQIHLIQIIRYSFW